MRPSGARSFTKIAFIGLLAAASLTAFGQALKWEKTFPTAVQKATANKQPIFVDFYAEWCGPCKALEEVFADAKVRPLLLNATCLRIDVDQNQADAARFKVGSIPRLILLSPDGKRVLWDTVGYRDADTLREELAEAMHIKLNAIPTPKAAAVNPSLAKVQAALGKGTFGQLKTSDPVAAKQGMRLLVEELGAFNETEFKPVAKLLEKAGRDALPALVEGMAHKTLAVRVGAAKVASAVVGGKGLPFDPWAPAATRNGQLAAWRRLVGAPG